MSRAFWGYMLMCLVICNSSVWLVGWELKSRDKLILANSTVAAIGLIGFALYLM